MTQIKPENIKVGDEVQIDGSPNWREIHCAAGTFFNVVVGSEYPTVSIDLITAHHPAFDWGELREGMAFEDKHGRVGVFFGKHDPQSEFILLCMPGTKTYRKEELTRHPEGDIGEHDNV